MNIDKQIEYMEKEVEYYMNYFDRWAWAKEIDITKAILKTLKEYKEIELFRKSFKCGQPDKQGD